MASIAFNDGADAVLTNGMPISRFSNWTPLTRPIGDTANRSSDGLGMMFRTRTDYAASFEFRNIPMKEVASRYGRNILVAPTDFSNAAWVANTATPSGGSVTRSLSAGAWRITANGSYGSLVFDQPVTMPSSAMIYEIVACQSTGPTIGNQFALFDGTASQDIGSVAINYTTGELTITRGALGGDGKFRSEAFYLGAGFFRITLVATGQTAGNSVSCYVGWPGQAATSGDAMLVKSANLYGAQRNVELADRLIAHLVGGGTCSVTTDDRDGTVYATCGLAPGTTPSLTLADPVTLEYTLSLALINLDESPSQMVCRYA